MRLATRYQYVVEAGLTCELHTCDGGTQDTLDTRCPLPGGIRLTDGDFENNERKPHKAEEYTKDVRVGSQSHHVRDEPYDGAEDAQAGSPEKRKVRSTSGGSAVMVLQARFQRCV